MADDAVPSEVIAILGRMGAKGVQKAKCRVTDGPDKGKIVVRNIIGPVRIGDYVMLKETEMEAVGKFGRKG
ncbi:MAG: 30S ribosomal protein S28e [Candidatus Aenigmatarchaeota archaeon]